MASHQRRLVFVRHGMSIIDTHLPPGQWPLSDAGKEEVKALAVKLIGRGISVDSITTSPELKAVQTAKAVLEAFGVPSSTMVVEDGLCEHKRGDSVRSLSREEFLASREQLFGGDQSKLVFGVETAAAAIARFKAVVERSLKTTEKDVVIVTHGTVLSLYLGRRLGLDSMKLWSELKLPAGVILIEEGPEIILI